MGSGWQLRDTGSGGKRVCNSERGVIHISTGSNTPRPRTPTPRYRRLFGAWRGGLTTNGIHLNLTPRTAQQTGTTSPGARFQRAGVSSGPGVPTASSVLPITSQRSIRRS